MKITELIPVYVDEIPNELEEGKLYVSKKYLTVIHLCACGCKKKTVTPIGHSGWKLSEYNDIITNQPLISIRPSIGNFSGEKPYHAHYFITNNKIIWT